MKIWLDDIRQAPDGWEWCKNHLEFVDALHVLLNGPEEISFDHDLGEDSLDGSWCATFLINRGIDFGWNVPKWNVHSSNPCGRDNIISKMKSWERTCSEVIHEASPED